MAKNFVYKARDRAGQVTSGHVLADDEIAAAAHIRKQGYFITSLKEEKQSSSLAVWLQNQQRVKIKELAVFCRQFSTMINAGVPIISCINILIEQTANKKLKSILESMYKEIREGTPLSKTMHNYPQVFPEMMISLIEAGEVGGVLDTMMERLAAHFEKEHKMNEKVKSAMMYPSVVMGIAVMVVILILMFVLPTFVDMFRSMNVQLPLPTRILLGISDFVTQHIIWLILLAIAMLYMMVIALRKPHIRKQIDRVSLRMPIVGILIQKVGIARFSRTLSTLLRGGVPIMSALEVVEKTLGNRVMSDALAEAQTNIREGEGLAKTLSATKVFTPMIIQMVSIGEESGTTDQMLEKVADFYESDVDDMVSRLNSLMEPIIILFLGVTIGSIVIAILLPMFDIMTGIGVQH